MGKFVFAMMQSLDGYVDGAAGELALPPPGVALGPQELDPSVRMVALVRRHGRQATSGRPPFLFTNSPRPALPFHCPWSTSTSPRDSTTAGPPFTTRPSYGL